MPTIIHNVIQATSFGSKSRTTKSKTERTNSEASKAVTSKKREHDEEETRETEEIKGGMSKKQKVNAGNYKSFMSCKPDIFKGDKGATAALQWVDEIETTLRVSESPKSKWVSFATTLFKGVAHTWWKNLVRAKGRERAEGMTWKEFRESFLGKFVSASEREKLVNEYLHLEMIGLDSLKYTTRFNELVCLVPEAAGSEEAQIRKYIYGLVPEIRSVIRSSKPQTLDSAIDITYSITEDLIRARGSRRSNDQRNTGNEPKNQCKTCKKVHFGECYMNRCMNCGKGHKGECNLKTCNKCGKTGHLTSDCKKGMPGCYNCGDIGHIKSFCPTKDKNGKEMIVTSPTTTEPTI